MNDIPRSDDEIIRLFHEAGQGHVFRWWKDLDEARRNRLLGQLRAIDLKRVTLLADAVKAKCLNPPLKGKPQRPGCIRLPHTPKEVLERESAKHTGESLLRTGRVAVVTVAGGQGTRLGFNAPKGMYPIGPVSGKSLFQIHAERILAARRQYDNAIPWYIMTSDATHTATREYFESNDYLGLPPDDVHLFRQRMMPVLDFQFQLVMTAKDEILLSPNGHGGTLLALAESGSLDDMQARGIEQISYFQVDNPLVPALDPVFIGFHRLARAEMSSKSIPKRDPEEPIGAFVKIGGRLIVAEYSDLTPEQMRQRTSDGELLYGLGSPAIHMISVDFVREETTGGFKLPFHLAIKGAPYLDESGQLVQPEEQNVYKFETFIFDALRDAERSVVLEVRRDEEFSPLKNASGKDSPETCHRDMTALYARWLEEAGIAVPRELDGRPVHDIEISPLRALEAGDLAVHREAGRLHELDLQGPLYLDPEHGT